MKHFTKLLMSLAGLFIVAAIVLAIVGSAMGGSYRDTFQYTSFGKNDPRMIRFAEEVRELFDNGNGLHSGRIIYDDDYDYDYDYDYDDDVDPVEDTGFYDDFDDDFDDESYFVQPTAANVYNYKGKEHTITNIVLDLAETDTAEIITGDTFGITTDGLNLRVTESVQGNTWHVRAKLKGRTVTITIPEDAVFAHIELKVGAGSVIAEDLVAQQVIVAVDAGYVNIDNLQGKVIKLKASAGAIEAQGTVTKRAILYAGAGSVTFNTKEPADYGYIAKCKLGTVQIGDRSHTAMSATVRNNTSAPVVFKLTSEVGMAQVVF